MLLRFMALVTAVVHMVSAQSRGGTVLHQGEVGDAQSVIITARTRAFLSCESGDIVVKVNFTQPFRGLMYAHRSRTSPCRIHGTGDYYYELRIPLKGCGTWQESPRVFINNVTIRFHPALELEEDETKTVVCRYPPPLTPAPGSIQVIQPPTVIPSTVPTRVGTARLSELEILIIICLLLFLSLLTLGIGIAYFCLKRRNIHIVRKSTISASSAPPSQITRLSSSNMQSPSLLSSVLGHTVRIPRAIPYSVPVGRASALSSPDHPYEEYPASTSTTETTSGEISETSVSSSSLAEDKVDASRHLLYRKVGPKTLLSIPKAILRKTGTKRWRAEPNVHHHYSKATSSVSTSIRSPEMEDQTVTTVLGADDDNYGTIRNGASAIDRRKVKSSEVQTKAEMGKTIPPVYAQVDKIKKLVSKNQGISTDIPGESKPGQKISKWSARQTPIPGSARRQRQIITEKPEESKISEEITKNTTVTTSVRREVTETRIISPTTDVRSTDKMKKGGVSSQVLPAELDIHKKDAAALTTTTGQDLVPQQPPKSLLIRDVADIYLTTTVETESRELKTMVMRDTMEEHTKTDSRLSETQPLKDNLELTKSPKSKPPSTDNWNVVIRQRRPPQSDVTSGTDLDASNESSTEDTVETKTDRKKPEIKPHFDVTIRTIPPDELKPKETESIMPIPPLEMPQTISMIKEALMPKSLNKTTSKTEETVDDELKALKQKPKRKEKSSLPQRTVRWMDDTKDFNKEDDSTASSSDSFQSSESLRERSSSEVLEVAPTLPSQSKNVDHPMLERSTSEIVTSPEEHVRWIGGVVPVLESLSPEFLANIPVVIQGGFFNQQRSPMQDDKKDSK